MADNLHTLDLVQNIGQTYVVSPSLFGAKIIYLTRAGIGMIPVSGSAPTDEREYLFKTSGALAYKIRFYSAATQPQHIHIIYKI